MSGLRLAVAQPKLVARDVAANAHAHAALVTETQARVVIFPELSLTGYELDAPALSADDPRLAPLVDACAATGAVALAGAPVAGPHIAILAITGSGVTVAYRKQWLGDIEAQRFSPGPSPAIIEVGDMPLADGHAGSYPAPQRFTARRWRLGLAICKDIGVARHAADTCALGIDVYVAGTVKHAHEASIQAERAHRIATTHRVWVAIASFAGPTGGGFTETAAHSAIWSPDGTIVSQAGPHPGSFAVTTLR